MRFTTALFTMAVALPLCAQNGTLRCNDGDNWGDRGHFCEIREQTIPGTGSLTVDGGMNGGISIKAADRSDILVRAKVQTNAPTDSEAKADASQIHVAASGGQVRADGPSMGNDHGWGVSFEIFVPRTIDLKLTAHNGGLSVADVRGRIDFETVNGGVSLKRLAGTVHGATQNGGLSVELAGDRWDGAELDAKTTNGGVSVSMPASYNARLETSTVNGHINLDFPVTVSGKITHDISTTIGNGGPLIRVTTVNGGVKINRQS